jgi:hypothetical protein
MLSSHSEPTVASVFTPRTTIDPDGTVEGYASLFGEIDQARHGHAWSLCRYAGFAGNPSNPNAVPA